MGASAVNVGMKDFETRVLKAPVAVVDFWAPWCAPCRMFAPVFEKVAQANPDVVFAKVNTEEEQELAGALQITSIPTVMVFRDGILLFAQPGMLPQAALEELLKKVRALDMEQVRQEMEEEEAAEAARASGANKDAAPGTHPAH